MRLFVPLVASDLRHAQLPKVAPVELLAADAEDYDESSEAVLEEAGYRSLLRAQELGETPARIVAVAEVKNASIQLQDWIQTDAIMADDIEGLSAARAALEAETQEDADAAMGELFQVALSWYDVSEREELASALGA